MTNPTTAAPEIAEPTAAETREPVFVPRVEIHETAAEVVLAADLPGAKAESIDVQFEKGRLTLTAKVDGRQPKGVRYLRNEYGVGDFHRAFQVGDAIDPAKISAEYRDGVLTLHLPKAEAALHRRIEIRAD
ncbi:MAG: Hsp20/alpha crystallin family protein [Planctomycetia bacterium]